MRDKRTRRAFKSALCHLTNSVLDPKLDDIRSNFKGLRKSADATRDALKLGLVLYDGEQTVPFGDRLFAAPVWD